jgi:plasmid stabilization system protein ParE
MDCKINWTNRAWLTYEANIDYLSKNPRIGRRRDTKYPNIRSTLVHKRILLVYKHKPLKNEIDLLVFWNTYQNPKKLKVQ